MAGSAPPSFEDLANEGDYPGLTPSVLLLAVPQSSSEGIIGALVDEDTGVPRSTHQVIVPEVVTSTSHTSYSGVREFSVAGGVAVGNDLMGIEASRMSVTHISYDVYVTETQYQVGRAQYDADSGCCVQGGRLDCECAGQYVHRTYKGDGTVRYLAVGQSAVSGGVDEVFEARDGARYLVLSERQFWSAVFAVETAPTEEVCRWAYCDEWALGGTCGRCSVVGGRSEPFRHAPASSVLRLRCSDMPPSAEVVAYMDGEVEMDGLWSTGLERTVEMSIESAGQSRSRHNVPAVSTTDNGTPSIAFESPSFRVNAQGDVEVQLRIDTCDANGPRRCRLAEDFLLEVRTLMSVDG